jgi:hypothetical protein
VNLASIHRLKQQQQQQHQRGAVAAAAVVVVAAADAVLLSSGAGHWITSLAGEPLPIEADVANHPQAPAAESKESKSITKPKP